jgi:PIN domain nuclease of toxin-antitoxin system
LKLLLDTQAVLWWFNGHQALSTAARSAIGDQENQVFVSTVSAMGIATKHRLGKLPQAAAIEARFEAMIADQAFTPLGINLPHALLAGRLALAHKDPFDRLLIAQALLDNLALVSNEAIFDAAGVSRVW